jgi:hypothetical protein
MSCAVVPNAKAFFSDVERLEQSPDLIMKREALRGSSSRGPTSITVFWPIQFRKGQFSLSLCRAAVEILTKRHPNLQTSFSIRDAAVKWFQLTPAHVPIREYKDDGSLDFWRKMVKSELREPFNNPDRPAWRVAFATDKEKRTAFMAITILHALGDGVCLGRLAVQFNETVARLIAKQPIFEPARLVSPPLNTLLEKFPHPIGEPVIPQLPAPFYPSATGFSKHAFTKSPELVQNLATYCRKHGIKIHSALEAALVLAVKKVKPSPFATFTALSIVSLRDSLGVSKDDFRPLFSMVAVDGVDPNQSFLKIAQKIHTDLHSQLKAGKHVDSLKATEQELARNPTAEEMVSQIRIPPNLINVTNRQELGSSGSYPEGAADPVLTMPGIYGVGGNSPYFGLQGPGGIGITVGVTTFNGIFFTTASSLEDPKIGISERESEAILKEMENILIEVVRN